MIQKSLRKPSGICATSIDSGKVEVLEAREDKPIGAQYAGADSDARLSALRAVADETGATVHQVVFAWMLRHEQSVLPVFSASNPEQMRENLGALDVSLTALRRIRIEYR